MTKRTVRQPAPLPLNLTARCGSDNQWRIYTVFGGMRLDVIARGATREAAIAAIGPEYSDLPVR